LETARQIGLRPSQRIPLYNGPIECRFLRFDLYAGRSDSRKTTAASPSTEPHRESAESLPPHSQTATGDEAGSEPGSESGKSRHASRGRTWQDQAADFRNRLLRMSKHWAKWARRQDISCYRIYDRDVPEIPLSIDWYAGHLVVRVYGRPHDRSGVEQQIWQREMIETARAALDVPKSHVHAPDVDDSHAARQKAPAARGDSQQLREVAEAGLRILVDLDASATGLALDERVLRGKVREEAAGKRFLNLWGRSGVTTLFAAAGGAAHTTTVDAWPANLKWTRANLELGSIARRDHVLIEADPRDYLRQYDAARTPLFDLIVLRPPAPRATDDFARAGDVQRDLDELVDMVAACLTPGGKAYFITSATRFKLTPDRNPDVSVRDISRQTVPQDFRNKKVHRCWLIQRNA
jgi:23S rRNA G2069 N7-methylase RlmK/C1962 C5-methylase RlmI